MASFSKLSALAALLTCVPLATWAADARAGNGSAPSSPAYSWTHPYLGIQIGYGWGQHSSVDYATPPDLPQEPGHDPPYGGFSCAPALSGYYCGSPFKYDVDAVFTGLQAGRNWQRGLLVFGVEADFGKLNIGERMLSDRTVGQIFDEDVVEIDYGWFGTLTGRVGLARGRVLYYLKGGLAAAEISHTAYDLDDDNHDGVRELYRGSYSTAHGVETGWTAGAGVEYAVSGNWSIKAEYLYMDFGSRIAADYDGDLYKHESSLHTVKAALNYQFRPQADEPLR